MSFPVSSSRPAFIALVGALAALGMASAAQAQSSVQAYGLLDVSAGQFQAAGGAKDKSVQSGEMSTSYLGFKGSEDLGGGLSAKFAIESFLRADSGSAARFNGDAFWARAANAGLAGSFGTVLLGRNTPALFVSTLLFNAFGDSFGFSPSIRHYYTSGTMSVSGDSGWNQSVSYLSPNFGGLSGQVQVAGNDATNGRKVGGNVLYFGGAFSGTVAYQKVKAASANATTTWQLGGAYDFGAAKLFAQYGKITNDTLNVSNKLADAGVSVPVGKGKVLLQFGQDKANSGVKRTTVSGGYDYTLSKRADLYGVVMNDKLTNATTGNSFALGIRHKF
jgi:predicted porin